MVIRKGSVYRVDFSPGKGSEPLGRCPGLVVQGAQRRYPKLLRTYPFSLHSSVVGVIAPIKILV